MLFQSMGRMPPQVKVAAFTLCWPCWIDSTFWRRMWEGSQNLLAPLSFLPLPSLVILENEPMGQTAEVWQESDPAALSSAQLNFPECVALLIKSESCRALPVPTRFHWALPSQELRKGEEQQHCSTGAALPSSAPSSGSVSPGEQPGHILPSPWLPLSQPYKCFWSLRYLSCAR